MITNHEIIKNTLNQMKNRTAFTLQRSAHQEVRVETLSGITGYHQFYFPSPLGLEVCDDSFKCAQKDFSWNIAEKDWDTI